MANKIDSSTLPKYVHRDGILKAILSNGLVHTTRVPIDMEPEAVQTYADFFAGVAEWLRAGDGEDTEEVDP